MNKKTQIAVEEQIPSFLIEAAADDTSLDDLGQYVLPSRLKIMQAQSSGELADLYDTGEIVAIPVNQKVSGMADKKTGEAFYVVPLYFFAEYIIVNDWDLKDDENEPMILDRSYDPKSEIATIARDVAHSTKQHPTRKDFKVRYLEVLNYFVAIKGGEMDRQVVIMSFKSGDWRSGSNFATKIKQRRLGGSAIPMYGGVYRINSKLRNSKKGNFFGFDVNMINPEETDINPYIIDQEEFSYYKSLHDEFKSNKENMTMDYNDNVDEEVKVKDTVDGSSEF